MFELLSQALIIAGFTLMILNIISLVRFMRTQHDVLADTNAMVLTHVMLVFIVLFALVYAIIFFQDFAEISIGIILSSGSIFVTVALQWIYRLVATMKDTTLEMVEALSTVIDARDHDLTGHSRHVAAIALLIYDALPERQRATINRTNLEYAGLFHDIGKLGVPEAILNKPSALTEEEWEIMRQHPNIGDSILSHVASFNDVRTWIKYHHERMDGQGYYNVPGDQIPLATRIITVADTFSALLMKRPYKEAASYDECIQRIKAGSGTQFDPEIVDVFCSLGKDTVMDVSARLLSSATSATRFHAE